MKCYDCTVTRSRRNTVRPDLNCGVSQQAIFFCLNCKKWISLLYITIEIISALCFFYIQTCKGSDSNPRFKKSSRSSVYGLRLLFFYAFLRFWPFPGCA